ncbi:DNA polymerase thumb domain-containing protein [Streptomyces sp. NPDC102487]|uniref:DNA polymerase Y family protein n=1 Tax=Streptomyces sp. NPDC102487 TaxID=3366182 RepID=UPI0037FE93DF
MTSNRSILHLRFDMPPGFDAELPEQLRRLLENITPRVQMIEPDSAALDMTGALGYFHQDARGLTELIQLRVLAYFGVSSAAGAAPSRMLAAMACASTGSGRRLIIEDSPAAVRAFLRPRPVRELPGVGARATATLSDYGLHTVGDVADVPQLTLQRLLGARPGRTLHERAHGHDTTTVDPTPTPASMSSEHRYDRDELDPAQHRRALLALADDLGARLRRSDQIAAGVTLTVRYADASSTRRSRTLPEPTQHTVLLARTAYTLYASLGLQRARVRVITLRADALRSDDRATRQLTLDNSDDKPLAIEAVADRARARYGQNLLYPAALAVTRRPSTGADEPGGRG